MFGGKCSCTSVPTHMENGGVDRTVLDCWQNQYGPNGRLSSSFLLLIFILFFDLQKLDLPQIKYQAM